MNRWRRTIDPPIPSSYLNLQEILHSNEWRSLLEHNKGVFYMSCITTVNGSTAAVYGDPTFSQALQEVDTLYVTASGLTTPELNNTQTVVSITAEYRNRAYTFGWALLDNITPDVCHDTMVFIRRELVPTLRPTSIITNLDTNLRASVGDIWTVLQQANDTNMINMADDYHLRILIKIVAISWLPPGEIRQCFAWIKGSMNAETRVIFNPFIIWFEEHIIQALDPIVVSFYNKLQLFANVSLQIPRKLKNRTDADRCSTWKFYQKTLDIAVASWTDLATVQNGNARNVTLSPVVSSCIPRRSINRLWRQYERGMSNVRFLSVAASLIRPFLQMMIFQEEYIHNHFVLSPPQVPANERIEIQYDAPVPNDQLLRLELNFDENRHLRNQIIPELPGDEGADEAAVNVNEPEGNANGLLVQPHEWRCMMCQERKIQMICRPCNCVVLCQPCEAAMRINVGAPNLQCPFCLERANNFERVYIVESENPEAPYDFTCQICFREPITEMGQVCGELKACGTCVEVDNRLNGNNRPPKCLFCNVPGRMVHVNFRPAAV